MRHVLISGTSSGIGQNLTEALVKEGFVVWAGLRSPPLLSGHLEKYPQKLHVLKLDVTSSEDIAQAYEKISSDPSVKELILINNAGIGVGNPIECLPLEEWRKVFDVNVFGLVEVTQKFLPLLRRTQGRVINIGSISGRVASPFLAPYAASKFAVRAFTDSLRREISRFGVKVILVEPGPIKTAIWEKSLAKSHDLEQRLSPEMRKVYGPVLKALAAGVEKTAASAVAPEKVTRVVLHAIHSEKPHPYYLVGKSIRFTAFLVKYLPTGPLDRIISQGFRFLKSGRK